MPAESLFWNPNLPKKVVLFISAATLKNRGKINKLLTKKIFSVNCN